MRQPRQVIKGKGTCNVLHPWCEKRIAVMCIQRRQFTVAPTDGVQLGK
jgi:hypothetical protein